MLPWPCMSVWPCHPHCSSAPLAHYPSRKCDQAGIEARYQRFENWSVWKANKYSGLGRKEISLQVL